MMDRVTSLNRAMCSRGKIIIFGIDKLTFYIQQAIFSGKAVAGYPAQMAWLKSATLRCRAFNFCATGVWNTVGKRHVN